MVTRNAGPNFISSTRPIASKKVISSPSANSLNLSIVAGPIFLLGTLIILNKLTVSLGLFITLI